MANADPKELVPILMQARPNKVRVEGKSEDKYLEKLLAKARVITDSANRIWRKLMSKQETRTIIYLYLVLTTSQRTKCNMIWMKSKAPAQKVCFWMDPSERLVGYTQVPRSHHTIGMRIMQCAFQL